MLVVSTPGVVNHVRENGGRIHVWTDPHTCCSGNMTYLETGTAPEPGGRFVRFDADGFELWFDPGNRPAPDELHLDVKGSARSAWRPTGTAAPSRSDSQTRTRLQPLP